jgi:hypothetical protein
MLGKDIIDFITTRRLEHKDVIVNFSYKNNGAYVLEIKSINSDADDENIVLNIGEIDNILPDAELPIEESILLIERITYIDRLQSNKEIVNRLTELVKATRFELKYVGMDTNMDI